MEDDTTQDLLGHYGIYYYFSCAALLLLVREKERNMGKSKCNIRVVRRRKR